MSEGPNDEVEESDRRTRANLIGAIIVLALLIGGYWLFTTLNNARNLELCLESGRRNCDAN